MRHNEHGVGYHHTPNFGKMEIHARLAQHFRTLDTLQILQAWQQEQQALPRLFASVGVSGGRVSVLTLNRTVYGIFVVHKFESPVLRAVLKNGKSPSFSPR